MKTAPWNRTTLTLFVALLAACQPESKPRVNESGKGPSTGRGMVATVHPLASKAGLEAMRRGGNAVDAAIAAALTLGVVDGHNSGLGGGCFILIRTSDGKLIAIDGRETAPAKATRDMFIRDGRPDGALSQSGPLAVATPGALAAYDAALRKHGKLKLADLLLPAADLAEKGFTVDRIFSQRLRSASAKLAATTEARKIFLKPDGSPYAEGETLTQRDLANTYRSIAAYGTDFFYKDFFAEMVGKWMFENGGVLSHDDFAAYKPKERTPLVTTYRGHTVVSFPPPAGGVQVGEILNILENFDLVAIRKTDPALAAHITAEAMKLAFADRAHWMGDPDFVKVPADLTDKAYAKALAAKIDPTRAIEVDADDKPVSQRGDFELSTLNIELSGHTTHIAAADDEGNWVAITATINTTFGSGLVVPGTGVVLNNEMDDFAIAPGVPNAFGLVGAEANAVAPGKRPLSSMSPTIVLDQEGRPWLTLGAAGGPKIITQVVQAVVNQVDYGMGAKQAVAAARLHHQWKPDAVSVEPTFSESLRADLENRGHKIQVTNSAGVMQAVRYDHMTKSFIGVSDPRVNGAALGW